MKSLQAALASSLFAKHDRVTIAFDAEQNYCPLSFADARIPQSPFFSEATAQYQTLDGELFSEAKGAIEEGSAFRLLSHALTSTPDKAVLRACTASPHLRITKRFDIEAIQPWLHVRYSLRTTRTPIRAQATQIQVPAWRYGEDLENPLEADLFDFSFGRIYPDGTESPSYLTFWLRGRKTGLVLWTQNKEFMRRVIPRDTGLAGVHPALDNCSNRLDDPEWDERDFMKPHVWDYYLWPVRAREWKAASQALAEMRFCSWNPRHIVFQPKTKKHMANVLSITANDLVKVNPAAITKTGATGQWTYIQGSQGRTLLFAQDARNTAPLNVRHDLHGRYRIRLVVHGGAGVSLRAAGAKYSVPLRSDAMGFEIKTPFYNALLLRPPTSEMDAGEWKLNGGTLEVRANPAMYAQTILSEIRFEPVTTARKKSVQIEMAGIADAPDVVGNDSTPTDMPYRANVAEHARVGFSRVYWRADGQCCDFHTKVGTVRYPVRRTHGLFNPATLPYGHALRRYDLLTAAVEEGHRNGLEIYGYMRLNSFGGNVVPEFFLQHPELHDVAESGEPSSRMCYFLPEFRRWKIEIAREIVQRGVDGLLLDLTRTPPMVDYHPQVVGAYYNHHGVLPPRNLQRGYVSYGVHPLETGDEWRRWWKFRAEGFTQFGRELRNMLVEAGKPNLPVHVQVRPKMALFDGLDLGRWLDEKLIDLLNVWPASDGIVPDELFAAVRERIPIRFTLTATSNHPQHIPQMQEVLRDSRCAGVTLYESNAAVWSPMWRSALEELLGCGPT